MEELRKKVDPLRSRHKMLIQNKRFQMQLLTRIAQAVPWVTVISAVATAVVKAIKKVRFKFRDLEMEIAF